MKVLRWRGHFYSVWASSKRPNPRAPTPVHGTRQGQMRSEKLAMPLMAWNSGTNCLSVKCQSEKNIKRLRQVSLSSLSCPMAWRKKLILFHENISRIEDAHFMNFSRTVIFANMYIFIFHLTSFLKVKWVIFGDLKNKQRHPMVKFYDVGDLFYAPIPLL